MRLFPAMLLASSVAALPTLDPAESQTTTTVGQMTTTSSTVTIYPSKIPSPSSSTKPITVTTTTVRPIVTRTRTPTRTVTRSVSIKTLPPSKSPYTITVTHWYTPVPPEAQVTPDAAVRGKRSHGNFESLTVPVVTGVTSVSVDVVPAFTYDPTAVQVRGL